MMLSLTNRLWGDHLYACNLHSLIFLQPTPISDFHGKYFMS
jgi:hypothetical protein